MMADGISAPPGSSYKKRNNLNSLNNVANGSNCHDSPSLPARKSRQKSYTREIRSTNPVAIPDGKKDPLDRVNYAESHDLTAQKEPTNVAGSQEVFQNYENNDYLTPTDPPTYNESSLDCNSIDFPSSLVGSETSNTSSIQNRGRRFQRFDSGVGDCESMRRSSSVQLSTSPTCSTNSVFNTRLSTQYEQQYEDIDQYHRAHENRQQQQQQLSQRPSISSVKTGSVRNGLPRLPKVEVSGVTNSDSEDSDPVINSSIAEIVSHSMHDPRTGSLPHTYMPLNIKEHQMLSMKTRKKQCPSCWIVFLILLLLVSLTALSLSIYTLVAKSDVPESSILRHYENVSMTGGSDFHATVNDLQQKVDELKRENAALKEALLSHQQSLASSVEEKVTALSSHQQNLSRTLHLIEEKFDAEIANISLRPGPQGPPGVVNFSLCVTRSVQKNAPASQIIATETSYLPSDAELQNYFVTFAYCTYEGATGAILETQVNTTLNRNKYRCKCSGQVTGNAQTLCKTIIWMCPVGS